MGPTIFGHGPISPLEDKPCAAASILDELDGARVLHVLGALAVDLQNLISHLATQNTHRAQRVLSVFLSFLKKFSWCVVFRMSVYETPWNLVCVCVCVCVCVRVHLSTEVSYGQVFIMFMCGVCVSHLVKAGLPLSSIECLQVVHQQRPLEVGEGLHAHLPPRITAQPRHT